jgi:hypothetical protein
VSGAGFISSNSDTPGRREANEELPKEYKLKLTLLLTLPNGLVRVFDI